MQTMTKTAYIYALVDDFGDVKYVGSTSLTPQERAAVHYRNRRTARGNDELNAWLLGLSAAPRAILLQEVVWADRLKSETRWTRYYRALAGSTLLNKMDGVVPSAALAEHKRVNQLGHYRPHTTEGKARISSGVKKAWDRRRACAAEQARLEKVYGGTFYRIPRTVEELRAQLLASVDEGLAAWDARHPAYETAA